MARTNLFRLFGLVMGGFGESGAAPRRGWRLGLSYRTAIASGALLLLTVLTFGLLCGTIAHLSEAASTSDRTQMTLTAANRLERLIVDMESSERGYTMTGDARYLQPWQTALAEYPGQVSALRRSVAAGGHGTMRIPEIIRAADAYVWGYSLPLVTRQKSDPAVGRDPRVIAAGNQRLDALRSRFDALADGVRIQAREDRTRVVNASRQTTLTAAGAALASLLLIVTFLAYLSRSIVRPIRRAAAMAEGLAAGDMHLRMPETSPAEIGTLEQSFNTMARSLEANHLSLRQAACEQAALSRVATLVARAGPLQEVFQMATRELGQVLGADLALIDRLEADGTRTVVGSWHPAGASGPLPEPGERPPWDRATASVLATMRTVRWPGTGPDGDPRAGTGIAGPVMVGSHLWGTLGCRSDRPVRWPPSAEKRLSELAVLVGTAIANHESRSSLVAARARLVAASDETRRRIERDLHDGVQQRLVSLGLKLRAAEAAVPAERPELGRRLAAVGRGLLGVLEDLREISRGLHPAILSRAGLEPALRALARNSALPVELDVRTGRLDEGVEAAVYYVVSEAVTNAIKHARASYVRVTVHAGDGAIRLSVRDDGAGGADMGGGSGLIGLKDRVEALGGTLRIDSPPGDGTCIEARVPVGAAAGVSAPAGPPGDAPPGR